MSLGRSRDHSWKIGPGLDEVVVEAVQMLVLGVVVVVLVLMPSEDIG